MSHKFLPFVTETSTPESIFKSIVQRSKGYSSKSLTTIYSAILVVGIKKVKEYVNSLPISLTSNQVMDKIAFNFIQFAVPNSQIDFWGKVCQLYDIKFLKLTAEYTQQELAVMLSSMAKHSPEALDSINFAWDVEKLNTFSSQDFDCSLTELQFTEFRVEGERIGFTSFDELKAFVCVTECNAAENTTILPIFIDAESTKDVSELYELHKCTNPFIDKKETSDDIPF